MSHSCTGGGVDNIIEGEKCLTRVVLILHVDHDSSPLLEDLKYFMIWGQRNPPLDKPNVHVYTGNVEK